MFSGFYIKSIRTSLKPISAVKAVRVPIEAERTRGVNVLLARVDVNLFLSAADAQVRTTNRL